MRARCRHTRTFQKYAGDGDVVIATRVRSVSSRPCNSQLQKSHASMQSAAHGYSERSRSVRTSLVPAATQTMVARQPARVRHLQAGAPLAMQAPAWPAVRHSLARPTRAARVSPAQAAAAQVAAAQQAQASRAASESAASAVRRAAFPIAAARAAPRPAVVRAPALVPVAGRALARAASIRAPRAA